MVHIFQLPLSTKIDHENTLLNQNPKCFVFSNTSISRGRMRREKTDKISLQGVLPDYCQRV